MQQHLVSSLMANNPDMSSSQASNVAKDIAHALMQGGGQLQSAIKRALDQDVKIPNVNENSTSKEVMSAVSASAGSLAGAMTGGKTAGDIASVGEFKNTEDYINSAKRQAIQKSSPAAKMLEMTNDPKKTNKILKSMEMHALNQHRMKEFTKDALESGIATIDPKTGELKSTSGDDWVRGMSKLGAAAMERDQRIMAGGMRMNLSTNANDGDTKIIADSSESDSMGYKRITNAKSNFATVAAKQIATNPSDTKEVNRLRNAILDTTDSASFVASKDGSIMGITSAGMKALKESGLLTSDELSKLDEVFVSREGDKNSGVGVGTYVLSTALGGAGIVATNNFSKKFASPTKQMTTSDIKANGGYEENGKWFDNKGQEVSVNDKGVVLNENGKPRMIRNENPDGIITKGAKGSWNGLTKAGNSLRNFLTAEQSIDEPTDSSQNNNSKKQSKSVDDSSTKHSDPLNKDNSILSKERNFVKTPESINKEIAEVAATPNEDLGKEKLENLVDEKLKTVPNDSKEAKALRQARSTLAGTGDVSQGLLKAGGISPKELQDNGIFTTQNEKGKQVVNFDETGDAEKTSRKVY